MPTTTSPASPVNGSLLNKGTAAYWVVTGLLALVLTGSGVGALTRQPFLVEAMESIGFPLYMMYILPTWYLLAAVALVAPILPWVKEWAYAGVFFAMTGALACHAFSGEALEDYVGAVMVLALTGTSYWLRPASLRLAGPT